MAAGSWVVTLTACCSMLAGLLVTVMGIALVVALFSGGGGPLGGVGIYVFVTLAIGPILILSGPAVILSAVKLLSGYMWARTALEIFWWAALLLTIGYLAYRGLTQRYILPEHVVTAALFFLGIGGPSIVMLFLLRSEPVRRALIR